MLSRNNVGSRRSVVNDTGLRAQNQTTSGQSTKKLFKAIDDENLGDFKRALAEGADVNAFNEEGITPLISIMNNLTVYSEAEKEYQSMIRLLLLHRSIDVNIQKKDDVNTALHLAMCFQQQKVLQLLLSHPRISIDLLNKNFQNLEQHARRNNVEHLIIEIQKAQTGKELLNALSNRNIDQAKGLLNQKLNPNCWKRNLNGEIETPLSLIIKSCLQGITQDNEEVLTKLLKHKELDFSQIKPIPAIEQNSRLKQIIEQVMKERLTDVINKKDLDDVKELVEDNCFINSEIVIALLRNVNNPIESIKNYLNEKFPASMEQPSANVHNVAPEINDDLIAQELQQLENLRDELERTRTQLRKKEQELGRVVSERTRDTNKISQLERDFRQERSAQQTRINTFTDQVARLTREKSQLENLRDDLERTKTQLRKKEQELGRVVSERDTNKISQLERDFRQERLELQAQNQDLKNKNRKLSEANIYNRRQSNYASASFVLSGAFAIGACLTISNLEICISLAVAAFVFLTIGCYCSYKASTVLSDVISTEFGNVISLR
ncbi:TomO hydrophobic C-terminal domain-containing protein [Wolbachia endosymbiont (group B) of Pammene fasciana]|uniref:TomO hydrophobic C-terminal domain-containing protein n=1 Tax=Wolbachia endosymbiont (group B) of Pammene fasciana TaxID=2954037 RepID=UPI002232A673|nr:ankyrin repeat domain-containing protein [Wolbachia endosymbiont (group B) of Pammene fasciana]